MINTSYRKYHTFPFAAGIRAGYPAVLPGQYGEINGKSQRDMKRRSVECTGSANHYNINNLVCVVKAYTTLGVAIGVVFFGVEYEYSMS
ncbi:hypothetical protein E2986_12812 [Frieseomelitta varia]|uniref:Uncharacterized protein n=1 Tax=Frieseomelitta varia TaxID=561572 RepID=A0A833RQM1_9HYME|nr:hypothetical protein E2986_12812 [Frieseomelitta varia]